MGVQRGFWGYVRTVGLVEWGYVYSGIGRVGLDGYCG